MKRIFIFFTLSLFFFALLNYLINSLPVINEVKVEELGNAYGIDSQEEFLAFFVDARESGVVLDYVIINNLLIVLFVGFMFVSLTFASLHLFIDKFFFKTFYQQPEVPIALRRGVFLSLLIISAFILQVLGVFTYYYLIFILLLLGSLELLLTLAARDKREASNVEDENV